ncbi:hypothetical protein HK099_004880 [Clydaea vesicula]|uniref:Uncharacterized protein n=1 Tax=Clydaea vesicula TaxID=447962 RepID=A0AAD5U6Q0_9FUNG|nr:hypothetical protein HK099_004880 [Clydaea vesicula]
MEYLYHVRSQARNLKDYCTSTVKPVKTSSKSKNVNYILFGLDDNCKEICVDTKNNYDPSDSWKLDFIKGFVARREQLRLYLEKLKILNGDNELNLNITLPKGGKNKWKIFCYGKTAEKNTDELSNDNNDLFFKSSAGAIQEKVHNITMTPQDPPKKAREEFDVQKDLNETYIYENSSAFKVIPSCQGEDKNFFTNISNDDLKSKNNVGSIQAPNLNSALENNTSEVIYVEDTSNFSPIIIEGRLPTINVLFNLTQSNTIALLNWHLEWLQENDSEEADFITEKQCQWIFGLLLHLHTLLTSDEIYVLRELTRKFLKLRENLIKVLDQEIEDDELEEGQCGENRTDDPRIVCLNMFIEIIRNVFGQKDL